MLNRPTDQVAAEHGPEMTTESLRQSVFNCKPYPIATAAAFITAAMRTAS